MADDELDTVEGATSQIRAALKLAKVRIYEDASADLVPPAAMIGAPLLKFGGQGFEPIEAVYPILLVVADDAESVKKLIRFLPTVVQAVHENVENAVVRDDADPGVFNAGGTQLPCYQITVDVAL